MPLFVCDKCKAIENTALGSYWYSKHKGEDALCSECMPYRKITKEGGKWHNKFPKTIATTEIIKDMGEGHFVYVADIPDVKAKNACVHQPDDDKPTSHSVRGGRPILRKLHCKCGNSFRARGDAACKKCGKLVTY